MASGWNLWAWLQCIGVVSGCCCKEVCTLKYIYLVDFSKLYVQA